eukprot:Nitzschia sp. Nitz4//scaffold51_size120721//39507//40051//NITZ4_003721-RA/size120721-snap-gene-0.35-mRNA-1//-1//CDS//3329553844//6168//frame0
MDDDTVLVVGTTVLMLMVGVFFMTTTFWISVALFLLNPLFLLVTVTILGAYAEKKLGSIWNPSLQSIVGETTPDIYQACKDATTGISYFLYARSRLECARLAVLKFFFWIDSGVMFFSALAMPFSLAFPILVSDYKRGRVYVSLHDPQGTSWAPVRCIQILLDKKSAR